MYGEKNSIMMNEDEEYIKFNDFSSLSDVHIDNEEDNISNIGYLACNQNSKQIFKAFTKETLFFFFFLIFASLFFPFQIQSTDILHQFDSKHYPNYTIYTQIKNLPKFSLHGFFVSLELLDFKNYQYKPKHNNKIATFHQNKLKKSFLFNGNLSIQLVNIQKNKNNENIFFDSNFQHLFLVWKKFDIFNFRSISQTDEFILFSDKLPMYDIFELNMTFNAQHPRADTMIIKFYYCSFIYEIFDLFIRLSIIICILNTSPHFYYLKIILINIKSIFNKNQSENFTEKKLNIQQVLTFILRLITILYISIPIISGSVSSFSFYRFSNTSFIMNLYTIIRDVFFSFSLFYIISILKLTEKETDIYPKYLLQGEQKAEEKIVFDECYDNPLSILLKSFTIIVPFLIFMVINDCEADFSYTKKNSNDYLSSLFDIQRNLISVSPEGFFVFRPLDSINYCHFLLFLVFLFFFVPTVLRLKKRLLKNNLKMKDNSFELIKNRFRNYFFISLPFTCLLLLSSLKCFINFTWFFSKSEIIDFRKERKEIFFTSLNTTLQSEPIKNIVNFTSASFESNEYDKISYLKTFFFFSLTKLFSFGEKNALVPTLYIIVPSLFTILMSILHTPSKVIME